jgi:hypothetical protein
MSMVVYIRDRCMMAGTLVYNGRECVMQWRGLELLIPLRLPSPSLICFTLYRLPSPAASTRRNICDETVIPVNRCVVGLGRGCRDLSELDRGL